MCISSVFQAICQEGSEDGQNQNGVPVEAQHGQAEIQPAQALGEISQSDAAILR